MLEEPFSCELLCSSTYHNTKCKNKTQATQDTVRPSHCRVAPNRSHGQGNFKRKVFNGALPCSLRGESRVIREGSLVAGRQGVGAVAESSCRLGRGLAFEIQPGQALSNKANACS